MIKVLEILKRKYVFSEKYIKFIESIFVSIGTPYIWQAAVSYKSVSKWRGNTVPLVAHALQRQLFYDQSGIHNSRSSRLMESFDCSWKAIPWQAWMLPSIVSFLQSKLPHQKKVRTELL